MTMDNEEFYVGWMQNAPVSLTRFIKKYLLLLTTVIIVIGILLAISQKKFSTAKFEYGKPSVVEGSFSFIPVPHLLVMDGESTMFVPLVGYGKHGADGVMNELQQNKDTLLEGKKISIRGTLLYSDGKVLMQVDRNDDPLLAVLNESVVSPEIKDLGITDLKGEVIDPKCYFGVMKPGEGKVHKDCAIRCISGGIPPVLAVTNKKGERTYVLLVGANREKINDKVLDFVAVTSSVSGHLFQYADWMVMEVNNISSGTANAVINSNSKDALLGCSSSCCKKPL
jgi:hypothetical protein